MSESKHDLARFAEIEQLVNSISDIPDSGARSVCVELLTRLLELHGAGLERIVSMISQSGAAGADIVQRLTRDDLAASLLLLYGLHPTDLETRVKQALDKVRPQLKSHGGDVALLGIDDGAVRLRLDGSCHGCPSSSLTLRNVIEEAIYAAAPDIASLEVAGVEDRPHAHGGFVPLQILQGNGHAVR